MNPKGGIPKSISVGPWGGQGGSPWDDGAYTAIRQIIIVHASAIDSIKIEYDQDGQPAWSERHGGNGGNKTDKIELDYPSESLTSMSGHYGPISHGTPNVIRSLTFQSNLKKYGPYGIECGTHFSFPMSGGKIVGFHGRSGWYLDSIGVYLWHLHGSSALTPNLSPSGSLKFDGNANKSYNALAVRESPENMRVRYSTLNNVSSSLRSVSGIGGTEDVIYNQLVPLYSMARSSVITSPVACGPWGGNGGSIFDDGIYTGVRQIILTRGSGITSMKVEYDRNGLSIWGNRHGGTTTGIRTDKVVFDYPFEILTGITGYFGTVLLMGPTAIKSLTFHTTRGKYGPYGEEQGTFFSSSKFAEGMILGFHGRKGWYLDAIGVHVLEGPVFNRLYPSGNPFNLDGAGSFNGDGDTFRGSNKFMLQSGESQAEQVTPGVMTEPIPVGPGPWGGDGGKPWDDGVFSGVKQIVIIRQEFIDSIQIEYERNGQSVWSMRHGGSGGDTTNRIKFDHPNEVLTCVSGYYSPHLQEGGPEVLRSLTFHSSRGKYGPFGQELGKFFTSATTGGKIVGFHGRSGVYLHAIGVHIQHWLGDQKSSKSKVKPKLFGITTKANTNTQ